MFIDCINNDKKMELVYLTARCNLDDSYRCERTPEGDYNCTHIHCGHEEAEKFTLTAEQMRPLLKNFNRKTFTAELETFAEIPRI